jgi:hypothetical protein
MSLGLNERRRNEIELGIWEVRDGIVAIYRPINIDCSDPRFFEELEEAIKSYFPGAKIDRGDFCGDDEAIHFWVGNLLFHACYTEPEEVIIVPEVQCSICGTWITIDLLATHLAFEHDMEAEEGR